MPNGFWAGILGGTLSGAIAGFFGTYLANVASHSYKRTPHAWRAWFNAAALVCLGAIFISGGILWASIALIEVALPDPELVAEGFRPTYEYLKRLNDEDDLTDNQLLGLAGIYTLIGLGFLVPGSKMMGKAWRRIATAAEREKGLEESVDPSPSPD